MLISFSLNGFRLDITRSHTTIGFHRVGRRAPMTSSTHSTTANGPLRKPMTANYIAEDTLEHIGPLPLMVYAVHRWSKLATDWCVVCITCETTDGASRPNYDVPDNKKWVSQPHIPERNLGASHHTENWHRCLRLWTRRLLCTFLVWYCAVYLDHCSCSKQLQ
jgi:hypothetical protein